ncbi:hypothetical protein [Pseudooceanicola sp. LIPI14-2-Ac024]|uniref:hypothetical protein n=1 Tax=Pseudooceanicola sp. LIPI14-2-Ac024 TaxID=3344875 RepID=UPI0035D12DE5
MGPVKAKVLAGAAVLAAGWAINAFIVVPLQGHEPPVVAARPGSPRSSTFEMGEARAISGDHFVIKGRGVRLRGVLCPEAESEAGRNAKAFLNQALRTNVECDMSGSPGAVWRGSCRANGRDVAGALIEAGYCVAR